MEALPLLQPSTQRHDGRHRLNDGVYGRHRLDWRVVGRHHLHDRDDGRVPPPELSHCRRIVGWYRLHCGGDGRHRLDRYGVGQHHLHGCDGGRHRLDWSVVVITSMVEMTGPTAAEHPCVVVPVLATEEPHASQP